MSADDEPPQGQRTYIDFYGDVWVLDSDGTHAYFSKEPGFNSGLYGLGSPWTWDAPKGFDVGATDEYGRVLRRYSKG